MKAVSMLRAVQLALQVLLAGAIVLPSAAYAAGAAPQQFKGWDATCRDDGYCWATTTDRASGSASAAHFSLGRPAQQTYWELSFTPTQPPEAGQAFTASVDGHAITFTPPADIAPFGSARDFYLLGKPVQELLDRLVPGKQLKLDFTAEGGKSESATFALAGLSAALIWIDTAQHRLGAERVAETPPYGLAPAQLGKAPGAGAGAPPTLLVQLNADSSCNARDLTADQLSATDLGGGTTLWLVPCAELPGNDVRKAYLGAQDTFTPVAFPEFLPSGGWTATPFLFNPKVDPASLTIISKFAGDAAGSCGTQGSWTWADVPFAGKAFKLTGFRAKESCDGKGGDFPLVYVASP